MVLSICVETIGESTNMSRSISESSRASPRASLPNSQLSRGSGNAFSAVLMASVIFVLLILF